MEIEKQKKRFTISLLTYGDYPQYFLRSLDSIIRYTPLDRFNLIVGFDAAPLSARIFDKITRQRELHTLASTAYCHNFYNNIGKPAMLKKMWYDPRIETEHLISFDDDSFVSEGWFEAMESMIDADSPDYFGSPYQVTVNPLQRGYITHADWYDFERDDWLGIVPAGEPAKVGFFTGGLYGIKTEKLYECGWPDLDYQYENLKIADIGDDVVLGAIARSKHWKVRNHTVGMNINRNLLGNGTATRRGKPSSPYN